MAGKRQGESEVEHPRKKNCFAVHRPSLAVVDVLRAYGRAIVSQYCKLPTACLRSIEPEAFSGSASTSIREDSDTKTEVSHDGASFLRSVAGCFSVARRIPRSAHRPIRGRPTTRGFPVGYLGFRAKICLGGCTISDSPAIPIRKSNLPFRAFALPVYYRKRPLMAIALQFFVCLAISMLPRVSR